MLRGQKRTEMTYCTQLWSDDILPATGGIWGGAVLKKTPIRMYITMSNPILLNRVLRKSTSPTSCVAAGTGADE